MNNTQALAEKLSSQQKPRISYKDFLSERLLKQQSKEASQRDIAENLQEGSEYVREGRKNKTYTRTTPDKGQGTATKTKDSSCIGGIFGTLGDILLTGFKGLFSNIGLTILGLVALMFPKQALQVVESLVTGLKHLGIVVLKLVSSMISGLQFLNKHGIGAEEIGKGAVAAGSAYAGAKMFKIIKGAGKLFGLGTSVSTQSVAADSASEHLRKANKLFRKPLLERLKIFFTTPIGKSLLARIGTKLTFSAGASLAGGIPGWLIVNAGLSAWAAWEIYGYFTEWDSQQEGGGQTKDELEAARKAVLEASTDEEKKKAQEMMQMAETAVELDKAKQAVDDTGVLLSKTDVEGAWKNIYEQYDKATGGGAGESSRPSSTYTRNPNTSYEKEALKYKGTSGVKDILDMIGKAEGGAAGYNAWNGGMPKEWIGQKLTDKTINEIISMQESNKPNGPTKGSEAAGRYQFMPDTLKALLTGFKLNGSEKFSEEMQDDLALMRIHQMRGSSLNKLLGGSIGTDEFNKSILPEWAGIPATTRQVYKNGKVVEPGKSYWEGVAGNRATITEAEAKSAQNAAWGKGFDKIVPAPVAGAPTSGDTTEKKSSEQFTVTDALYAFMRKGLPDTKQTPTVINNNNTRTSGAEPASVWNFEWAKDVMRQNQVSGRFVGQPGM